MFIPIIMIHHCTVVIFQKHRLGSDKRKNNAFQAIIIVAYCLFEEKSEVVTSVTNHRIIFIVDSLLFRAEVSKQQECFVVLFNTCIVTKLEITFFCTRPSD